MGSVWQASSSRVLARVVFIPLVHFDQVLSWGMSCLFHTCTVVKGSLQAGSSPKYAGTVTTALVGRAPNPASCCLWGTKLGK